MAKRVVNYTCWNVATNVTTDNNSIGCVYHVTTRGENKQRRKQLGTSS